MKLGWKVFWTKTLYKKLKGFVLISLKYLISNPNDLCKSKTQVCTVEEDEKQKSSEKSKFKLERKYTEMFTEASHLFNLYFTSN